MLKFKVNGQTLSRVDGFRVVGDSRNYLKARFEFSDDWEGFMPVIASFCRAESNLPPWEVEVLDGECAVPWEALTGSGTLEVTVSGGDLITTNGVSIHIANAGRSMLLIPQDETKGAFGLLLDRVLKLEKSVADNVVGVTAEELEVIIEEAGL